MNPLAERIVRAIIAKRPGFDPVAAFDDIAELNRLAVEMAKAPDSKKYSAFATPVIVGNIKLYPLALGAELWLDRFRSWFAGKPDGCDVAYLFALAHGHEPVLMHNGFVKKYALLRELDDPESAWNAVNTWALRCTASSDECFAAAATLRSTSRDITPDFKLSVLRVMLEQDTFDAEDAKKTLKSLDEREAKYGSDDVIGSVLSYLLDAFGGTPEYWLWEQPSENIQTLLYAKAQHSKGEPSKDEAKARATWEDEAHGRFWSFQKAFLKKHGGEDEAAAIP